MDISCSDKRLLAWSVPGRKCERRIGLGVLHAEGIYPEDLSRHAGFEHIVNFTRSDLTVHHGLVGLSTADPRLVTQAF